MTLRLRLTLLITVILVVVLSSFGAGVYVLLNKTMHDNLDRDILRYATEVVTAIDAGEEPTTYFGRVDFITELLSPTGSVLPIQPFSSTELLPKSSRAQNVASERDARPYYEDITVRGVPLRLYVLHIPSLRYDGAMLVAAPRRAISETLRRLRLLLLWAGLIGLALAAGVAWQTARTALRPVEEVANAATEIGTTGDLSKRVDPGGGDELGKLTVAFNAMLDRLEEAHHTLERTLESQSRFLADASHELRTPLTTMRGNLEVMRSSPEMPETDRVDALRDSIEEAERMSHLVEDLLALARADAQAPMPVEPVALAEAASDAIATASAAQAASVGSSPAIHLNADDSLVVSGSGDLLRRMIANLVENAIKYTPSDGRVEVTVTRESGWAVLRVADTGIGMSEPEIAHAFDRFWRSDKSRGERGSGLGLSIVKSVAEDHGGSIQAASDVGAGTTMTVRLPLAPTSPGAPASPASPQAPEAPEAPAS